MAVHIMVNTNTEVEPTNPDVKFISVKRLCDGGIVYKVNSNKAADWIKEPARLEALINCYDALASAKPNRYVVIVENVPIYFDPQNTFTKAKVADSNVITAEDILEIRYMKPSN